MPDKVVRAIDFSPNAVTSFVLAFSESECVIYSSEQNLPIQKLDIPWADDELYELDYDYQVDVIFFTHPSYPPKLMKYVGGDTPFVLSDLTDEDDWKTAPFLAEDTSGISLKVTDEAHFVKLVSTEADFQSLLGVDLSATPTYIELRVKNKWALYRLVDTNYSTDVPEGPTPSTCYALPLQKIVTDVDSSASFALLKPEYLELAETLEADELELRSDTLVFNHDLVGAYMRVPVNYRKLWPDNRYAVDTTHWVRLNEYIGHDDFSTELLTGPFNDGDFTTGSTYKILVADGFRFVTSAPWDEVNNPPDFNWVKGRPYTNNGAQFVAIDGWAVDGDTDDDGVWDTGGGTNNSRVVNMSKLQTFDIMKTTLPLTILATTGTITFDDENSFHTARLTASKSIFTEEFEGTADDDARYIMVKYGSDWTTYKVLAYIDETTVDVTVLDTIPYQDGTEEFVSNGLSSTFRLSAWYKDNYPYTVKIHEQRLIFGGNQSNPETLWFSKITDLYDFRTVETDGEVLDTTGITYSLGGRSFNRIRWMTSGPTLVIGTESSEWQIRPNTFGEALTATNIRITRETTEGSLLFGYRVGSSIVFPERTGKYLKELYYDYQTDQFGVRDLNLLADHLFRRDRIIDFAYQKTPIPMLWVVTELGLAYSLLYDPAQELYAWARHTTRSGDKFRSVAVMPRNATIPDDRVYFMIQRGDEVHVEFMEEFFYDASADNFKEEMRFLDSSLRHPETGYLDAPVVGVSGADALEGEEVSVVVDGAYVGTQVVTGGSITLAQFREDLVANKYILIGFAYTSELETLPMDVAAGEADEYYGSKNRISRVGGYFLNTLGGQIGGSDEEVISEIRFRDPDDAMDQSPELFTGFLDPVPLDNEVTMDKKLTVKQTLPYPMTIVNLIPEI